ncbi:hypothetical protein [Streptomyces sp. NPDC059788]|uniref:hypothetical protein n=1 Tax=Streptomyces sp. NPDC059788 TaxID=3346948 RepID=UPI0036541D78
MTATSKGNSFPTQDDVKRAIAIRKGTPVRSIHIVLRNVFLALLQEGMIFRDPTRGYVFAWIINTAPSVPSSSATHVWTNSPTAAPSLGSVNVTAAGR